jgi:hypothetical protein
VAGTFSERIDELKAMVGTGDLVGKVEVSQVYAQRQHEELSWAHPRGGQALYLSQPLLENHSRYLQAYADRLLEDGGVGAMIENVEDLAEDGGVATRAPVLYSNLRASGHPSVTSGEVTVYDRPARQHRLSEEELRALYRLHHPVPERGSREPWNRGV